MPLRLGSVNRLAHSLATLARFVLRLRLSLSPLSFRNMADESFALNTNTSAGERGPSDNIQSDGDGAETEASNVEVERSLRGNIRSREMCYYESPADDDEDITSRDSDDDPYASDVNRYESSGLASNTSTDEFLSSAEDAEEEQQEREEAVDPPRKRRRLISRSSTSSDLPAPPSPEAGPSTSRPHRVRRERLCDRCKSELKSVRQACRVMSSDSETDDSGENEPLRRISRNWV